MAHKGISLPEPTVSVAGSYCRTASFVNEAVPDLVLWREAIEHPLTNRWSVQECCLQPNIYDNKSEYVVDITPVKGGEDVSLKEAVQLLSTYEYTQLKMQAKYKEKPVEFGDEHIEQFAGMNGFILDIHGKAHVSYGGRPAATEAKFSPESLKGARENFLREPEDKPLVDDTGLSHLFRSSVEVDNLDRILDLKSQKQAWTDVVSKLKAVVTTSFYIHKVGFSITEKNSAMGLLTEKIWEGQVEYEEAVEVAQKALLSCSFISENDIKTKYQSFFDMIHLGLEVSSAKRLYQKYSGENSDIVKTQTKKATDYARTMGASDRDIRRLNAVIIDGDGYSDYSDNEYIRDCVSYKSGEQAYFVPDEVGDFLEGLEKITQGFKSNIEQQEKNIRQPAAQGHKSAFEAK